MPKKFKFKTVAINDKFDKRMERLLNKFAAEGRSIEFRERAKDGAFLVVGILPRQDPSFHVQAMTPEMVEAMLSAAKMPQEGPQEGAGDLTLPKVPNGYVQSILNVLAPTVDGAKDLEAARTLLKAPIAAAIAQVPAKELHEVADFVEKLAIYHEARHKGHGCGDEMRIPKEMRFLATVLKETLNKGAS